SGSTAHRVLLSFPTRRSSDLYVGAACGHDIDASLKIAIAEGIIEGPRIRACSAHIGTTGDVNDSRKWWRRFDSPGTDVFVDGPRSEEHTSELQSRENLVCRLL